MKEYLPIIQIIVAILIIILILLQQRGTALGSAFGGDSGGGSYSTRRGLQQKIFIASIVLTVVFILLAALNLLIS